MAEQHHISIQKSARYFTLGENNNSIENIWFVLHGYSHLANYFIRKFEPINNGKNLIVAPEGLHRFYTNGLSGRVGASWMTKEDRLTDIEDYIRYLNDLHQHISAIHPTAKINVLGFSQGAATASRWVGAGHSKVDHFILWSGVFPPDMDFEINKTVFNQTKNWLVIGTSDEFISMEAFNKHQQVLNEQQIDYQTVQFEGKHDIPKEVLLQLADKL
jgi:predicted esterase